MSSGLQGEDLEVRRAKTNASRGGDAAFHQVRALISFGIQSRLHALVAIHHLPSKHPRWVNHRFGRPAVFEWLKGLEMLPCPECRSLGSARNILIRNLLFFRYFLARSTLTPSSTPCGGRRSRSFQREILGGVPTRRQI